MDLTARHPLRFANKSRPAPHGHGYTRYIRKIVPLPNSRGSPRPNARLLPPAFRVRNHSTTAPPCLASETNLHSRPPKIPRVDRDSAIDQPRQSAPGPATAESIQLSTTRAPLQRFPTSAEP